MAVAASEGTFCLCSLKSMEVMNEEVQETSELNPIKEVGSTENQLCLHD